MKPFFERYVEGKELPDLDEFLAPYGYKVSRNAKGKPARGAFRDVEDLTEAQLKLREAFFALPPEAAGR